MARFITTPAPTEPDWVINPQRYAKDSSGNFVLNRFGNPVAIAQDGGGLFGGGLFGGVGDFFASIDPGPAVGNALAESDKFVNREIPGGYALPAALAVAAATGYIDPTLFVSEAAATAAAEAGVGAIATEVGQAAFFEALAAGASSAEAISAGIAAETAIAGGAALTTGEILGSSGFTPLGDASFVIDPSIAYTANPSALTTAELLNSSGFMPTEGSNFAIDPTAPYTTSTTAPISTNVGMGAETPLQGPTYQELGVTGVPEGGMGPTYGEMGYTGLNQGEAIAAADAASTSAPVYDYSQPLFPEQAGPTYQELGVTGVEGGMSGPTYQELGYTGLNQNQAIAAADVAAAEAANGISAKDILSNANKAKNLAKLLGSGNTATAPKTTTGVNAQQLASLLGSNLPTQAAPGNIYRMNQNPFTFGTQGQTPVSQGMYDVSGTNPMANALRKA